MTELVLFLLELLVLVPLELLVLALVMRAASAGSAGNLCCS